MFELVSFFSGMSIMILELAGMRTIVPYLGSSFIVWTSIIGIIMFSLSIGYFFGGKLADKNLSIRVLSLILFSAGLYLFFVSLFEYSFLELMLPLIKSNIYFSSIFVGIVLFSLPSILLGMVSPYIIKIAMYTRTISDDKTGAVIGKFHAISTIGSIIGTFLSGFYLIVFFGLETILYVLAFLIILLSLLLSFSELKHNLKNKRDMMFFIFHILFSIFIFFFICYKNHSSVKIFENCVYSKTTPYSYHCVCETKDVIFLLDAVSVLQSFKLKNLGDEDFLNTYHKLFFHFFKQKNKKNNSLIIGNGAGIFLSGLISYIERMELENAFIDVVEIDEELLHIAKKYFGLKDSKFVSFFHQDGRIFINSRNINNEKKYDLIFFDTYTDSIFIPVQLLTYENFINTRNILSNDGIILINVISNFKGNMNDYLRQVYTQVKSVFKYVNVYFPTGAETENGVFNFVIVASPSELPILSSDFGYTKYFDILTVEQIFTDKHAPIEKFIIKGRYK